MPEEKEMIDLHPTICNICGGKVVFISNSKIYGKEYGSGKMYYCTNCGAFVGTHVSRPEEAFGILANKEMRELKKQCHTLFDVNWKSENSHSGYRKARSRAYKKLAKALEIPLSDCHFGYFDMEMLIKAYKILSYREIRLIISGPKKCKDKEKVFSNIDQFKGKYGINEIIADDEGSINIFAEEYAMQHQIPFRRFTIDRNKNRKNARAIRNREMIEYGNILLMFDQKSEETKNMICTARKYHLKGLVIPL